jgi:hypothetical protein
MHALQLGAIAMMSVAGPVAPELVANGNFDQDLSSWQAIGPGPWQALWNMQDVDANPSSGSVLLSNMSPAADTTAIVLRQCLATPLRGTYVIRGSGFTPTAQASTGYWVVGWGQRYDSVDCTGGGQGFGGLFAPGVVGSWVTQAWPITFYSAPVNGTIEVALQIHKTEAGGQFDGYVDAVSLTYDTLLWDGFDPPQ